MSSLNAWGHTGMKLDEEFNYNKNIIFGRTVIEANIIQERPFGRVLVSRGMKFQIK
jgi:hypothetical protein